MGEGRFLPEDKVHQGEDRIKEDKKEIDGPKDGGENGDNHVFREDVFPCEKNAEFKESHHPGKNEDDHEAKEEEDMPKNSHRLPPKKVSIIVVVTKS